MDRNTFEEWKDDVRLILSAMLRGQQPKSGSATQCIVDDAILGAQRLYEHFDAVEANVEDEEPDTLPIGFHGRHRPEDGRGPGPDG